MIAVWARGSRSRCLDSSVGIPFGRTYFSKAILQINYNNPNFQQLPPDSSGFKIFFINKRRNDNLGLIAIGQEAIAIPPRQPSTSVVGNGFNGQCSQQRLISFGPMKITSLFVHMHRLGNFVRVVLKHQNGREEVLIDQQTSYDRPTQINWPHSQAPTLQPGDNFQIECRYDSSSKDQWTFFGSSAQMDEMCFVFMDVYPRPLDKSFQLLDNHGDADYCDRDKGQIGACNTFQFFDKVAPITQSNDGGFETNCGCSTYPARSCTVQCYAFLQKWNLIGDQCLTEQSGTAFVWSTRFWAIRSPALAYQVQSQIEFCTKLRQPPTGNSCDRTAQTVAVSAPAASLQSLALTGTQSSSVFVVATVFFYFVIIIE